VLYVHKEALRLEHFALEGTSSFQSRSTIDGHHMTLASVFPPGEPGDRVQFSEFILANVRLYALRHDKSLSTHAVANFTRTELATALRKVPGVLLVSPCMLHPARHMPLPAWGRACCRLSSPSTC
jgi:20S proteasome subunit beta 4